MVFPCNAFVIIPTCQVLPVLVVAVITGCFDARALGDNLRTDL